MKNQTCPSFDEEKKLWKEGKLVIGVDEVGRGAFAGPIVASAVIFPTNFSYAQDSLIAQVSDSKRLKPLLREKLAIEIKKFCLYWSVSEVDVEIINKKGIGEANKMVFRQAVSKVISQAKKDGKIAFHLLVDGFHVKFVREIGLKNQKAIIKGDQISFSIAAASIVAKVHRDELMKKQSNKFPFYSFEKNKGYGTFDHQKALLKFGACDLHRSVFVLKYISS